MFDDLLPWVMGFLTSISKKFSGSPYSSSNVCLCSFLPFPSVTSLNEINGFADFMSNLSTSQLRGSVILCFSRLIPSREKMGNATESTCSLSRLGPDFQSDCRFELFPIAVQTNLHFRRNAARLSSRLSSHILLHFFFFFFFLNVN